VSALTRDLEFSFHGMPVGYFEESDYPRSGGCFRYMPYRGPGHYNMNKELARGPVQCSFNDGDSVYEFVVVSVPEYGVLLIEAVRRGQPP
jgi:hypothetical protein